MTERHSAEIAAHLAHEHVQEHAREQGDSLRGEITQHPIEVVSAVSLAIAALLTSWSAYHAAVWDGVESAQLARAEELRTQSAQLATRAGQLQALDVLMASQWLNAYATGDTKLQAFYRARFRPEFTPAFEAWLATKPLTNPKAPPTPFAMPNYQSATQRQAAEIDRQAAAAYDRGEEAKTHSNALIQVTVVLASSMFFGGIGQVFKMRRVRFGLMLVSVLMCLWGFLKVLALPIS